MFEIERWLVDLVQITKFSPLKKLPFSTSLSLVSLIYDFLFTVHQLCTTKESKDRESNVNFGSIEICVSKMSSRDRVIPKDECGGGSAWSAGMIDSYLQLFSLQKRYHLNLNS